jgi:hypothetical protein
MHPIRDIYTRKYDLLSDRLTNSWRRVASETKRIAKQQPRGLQVQRNTKIL